MDYLERIIWAIETHSLEVIRDCFEHGVDPNSMFRGKPLIHELIGGYLRSNDFAPCVSLFVEYGLKGEDAAFLAVLENKSEKMEELIERDSTLIHRNYTFQSAFTPMKEASLLHIAAEHNHVACAEVLVKKGLDVNVQAGKDGLGFGGQTPIFHTVNQRHNHGLDTLKFLLDQGADLGITLTGLIWGKGYEWETFIPSVNPISYALMGLLPQFQRREKDIYLIVQELRKVACGQDYFPENVPNKYLNP